MPHPEEPAKPGASTDATLEARLRGAAGQVEADLKRWIAYFNDEVVPDVRRNGSSALKSAAAELDKLARRMDSHNPPPHRPRPKPAFSLTHPAMNPLCAPIRRLLLLAVLPPLLVVAGCHHAVYDASAQPPPPPLPPVRAPVTRSAPRPPRPSEPAISSAIDPDEYSLRKPVSTEVGLASWYGPPYHNRQAADGSIFDQNAMTAAHRTLPMGTTVRVTNLATNESVLVKITDRGPFVPNRILDLSLAAAKATGLYQMGVGKVRVEAFARAIPDTGGRWCVQIGAFLSQDDSIQLKNDLIRRYGATAKVVEFAGPTGHWVRINPLTPDHTTAQIIADSIHIPDATPYLVRLN